MIWFAACGTSTARSDGATSSPSTTSPLASTESAPRAPATSAPPSPHRARLAPASERQAAADFTGATGWLNTSRPLGPEDLRGHVVVVDFWTSCCINCLQTLPTLRALEAHFSPEELVVVGVQSPKFPAERDVERLRAFLSQYRIEHPVVVDGAMRIWQAWQVSAWPTVFVLDATGRVVWRDAGEPDLRELFGVVDAAIAEGRADHTLAPRRIEGIGAGARPDGALAFPGKITWLTDGGLAIADSGNHRVIILDRDRSVRLVVGTRGRAGFEEGPPTRALFHFPQGLVEHDGALYVADVENHAVRRVDLTTGQVRTVAGTGRLGQAPVPTEWASTRTALRSPWDVAFVGDRLFVALAGSHQIAEIDLRSERLRIFAGSGREARIDGPRLDAAFAQPSGLAVHDREIFVADSETSSVRAIDVASGQVRTVVGLDLFVFGDVDGERPVARLQHPLGVTFAQGRLFVADTYNGKIKSVDPRTGATTTAYSRDDAPLSEPGGLSGRGELLAIANTNANSILVLGPGRQVDSIELDPASLRPENVNRSADVAVRRPELLRFDDLAVSREGATLSIRLQLPTGTELNRDAPLSLVWATQSGLGRLPTALEATGASIGQTLDVSLSIAPNAEHAELAGVIDLVVCDAVTHRVCVPWTRRLEVGMRIVTEAGRRASFLLPLPEAR